MSAPEATPRGAWVVRASVAIALLVPAFAAGQAPAPPTGQRPPDAATLARTPWGDPDLQAAWAAVKLLGASVPPCVVSACLAGRLEFHPTR